MESSIAHPWSPSWLKKPWTAASTLLKHTPTSISENNTNITKVAIVNAVGNRLNEPLKYSILNPGNKFKIKSTSGVIQTTGVPFDREEQELYELVVEASRELDHLRVARVVVRVSIEDINDNSPVFVGLPYYAAVQVDAEAWHSDLPSDGH